MYVRESAGLNRAVNPCPSGHKSFARSFMFMVLKQAIAKSMKIFFDRYNLLAPRIQPLGVHWTPLVKDAIIFFYTTTPCTRLKIFFSAKDQPKLGKVTKY